MLMQRRPFDGEAQCASWQFALNHRQRFNVYLRGLPAIASVKMRWWMIAEIQLNYDAADRMPKIVKFQLAILQRRNSSSAFLPVIRK